MNIEKLDIHELLSLYASVMEELMERKVVRTSNNPVADYAEYLVARKMNFKLAPNSTSGYDASDESGVRYQIKGRRITAHNKSRQLGVIRKLDQDTFDYLIAVVFDRSFDVLAVYQIPRQIISLYSRFSVHVNGHILQLRGEILNDKMVKNLTALFR